MNYGYNEDSKGWDESKKLLLAQRLRALLITLGLQGKGVDYPYIEIDGLYDGVRIRKITYLGDGTRDDLIREADKIYDEVMKVKD